LERGTIARETAQDLVALDRSALLDVAPDRRPQRRSAFARRLLQALQLQLIRPQRQTEHVGYDLLAETLALELLDDSHENLVRDTGERGAHASRRRKAGD